ncbi:MAG TPA: hypothetical protein VNX01_08655 [Bacteroidia bacterium]|jgi:hypothetical protein|nr:hypothetical protein [Bacteroidia bacterium]
MFKGNASTSFKTSKTKKEVFDIIEEELEVLGTISISQSGNIEIVSSKFNGFGYKVTLDGKISERDGKYTINIDFNASPGFAAWAITICFFPLGACIMILPNNAQSDMQQKSDRTLMGIKSILEERYK